MDKSLQDKLLRSFPNTEYLGIKREYVTGRSGSPVFAVRYKPKNKYGLNGTFIVKIGSENWATAEQAFYNHSSTDALTPLLALPHMPSLPVEGQAALAYDVAFGSLIEPQPLMNILDEGSQSEGEAQKQIRDLSRALVDWYLDSDISSNSIVSDPHTLLFRMLTPKRANDTVEKLRKELPFWEPDALQISVEGLNRRLPNPLAYMQKDTWSRIQYSPNCPIGRIHGDLHTGNIMCLPKSKNLPKIIDFGQSIPDGVPFFDLAYLEFDIIQHLLSVEQVEDRKQWLSLLDFSMAGIVRKQQKMTWDAARAWRFIQPIRQQVKRLQAVDSEDYEIVWWLSTVAAGLNFARKGDHARSTFERMAGLLYAAYGLARILDMLHIKELITEHAPFIPWIQENFSHPISSVLPPSIVPTSTPPHEDSHKPDKSLRISTEASTQSASTEIDTSEIVSIKAHQPVQSELGQSFGETNGLVEAEQRKPLNLIYCYTHEDLALRDELERHLGALKRSRKITTWYDRDITPGAIWEDEIKRHLDSADIILLLVSPDFISSSYCYDVEMQRAIERHKSGEALVIPIILRPVDWEETPIGDYPVLPSNAEPTTLWPDRDAAFRDIAKGIRDVVRTLFYQGQNKEPQTSKVTLEEKPEFTGQRVGRSLARKTSRPEEQTKLKVFCSYAYEDKELWDEFRKHLSVWERLGYISGLQDRDIRDNFDWENRIDPRLESADIILLLISPNFIASDYYYDVEVYHALERDKAGEAHVVPIILRSVDWEGTLIDGLEVLPSQGKPITQWPDRDEAFRQVLRELREVVGIGSSLTEEKEKQQIEILHVGAGTIPNEQHKDKLYLGEPTSKEQTRDLKIFCCYAPEDDALRVELQMHLSVWKHQGQISEWHNRTIPDQIDWGHEIDPHLDDADIILFLISPYFIASDYYDSAELRRATDKHQAGEALIISIILRPVDWRESLFGEFEAVPSIGKPVTQWPDRDEAFRQVGEEIREATRKFLFQTQEADNQGISKTNAIQEIHSPSITNEQKDAHVSSLAIHGPVQGLVYGENNTVTIIFQDSKERTIPFLAPPQPTHNLIGREKLLQDLKQKLFRGGNLALSALNGLPGVGKTALVLALAHDQEVLAHFNDGVLWAGLGREENVFSYLSAWGIALGVSQGEIEKLTNPTSLAQTIYRAIGARRMLLVIDDAWSTEAALAFKLGGPHCAHIVTTRLPEVAERFAREGTITVHELHEDDSLRLLEQQAPGVSAQAPDEIREIIQAVDGLPLPLILMGNYLRIQMRTGQPRRLRAALDRLLQVKERLQLEQPQGSLERHPSLPEGIPLSQLAVIKISDEALDKEAQQVLRALSTFPSKPNSFSEEAALAVATTNMQAIDMLLDFGLLESSGPMRYTLHQTINDYAQINLTDTTVYERMVEFFIEFVQAHKTDRNLLERETSNILASVEIMLERGMALPGASAFAHFIRIVRRTRVI